MNSLRLRALGVAVVLLAPCAAAPARAQLAFSVAADSDDRFRGVSLSDGRPVASASVTSDHASGAYVGAQVIGVEGPGGGAEALGYIDYGGYSARMSDGLAWDVGVTNARYTQPTGEKYTADYTEVYAGLVGDNVAARVYFSPNYFGERAKTVYVDLSGAVRAARRWRLFGHLGALTAVGGSAGLGSHRAYFDLRAGVAFEFRSCELRLAWTTVGPKPDYPTGYPGRRDAVVLGATYSF